MSFRCGFCSGTSLRSAGDQRLFEAGGVAGSAAQDLRFRLGEVDHGRRLDPAVTGVHDGVDEMVEPFFDLPALGERFVVTG